MAVLLNPKPIKEGDTFSYLGALFLRLEAGGHAIKAVIDTKDEDEPNGPDTTIFCDDCNVKIKTLPDYRITVNEILEIAGDPDGELELPD